MITAGKAQIRRMPHHGSLQQRWVSTVLRPTRRRVWSTTHSGVKRLNGICANLVHHPPATSSARSATQSQSVLLTDWASCPQQVPLVMMRPVVSTAQSMTSNSTHKGHFRDKGCTGPAKLCAFCHYNCHTNADSAHHL